MASFLTALTLTPLSDGNRWKLDTEFDYWTDVLNPRVTFFVPSGFVTDLASIPRIFWNILPPFGRYTGAAIIHDYLYQTQPRVVGLAGLVPLIRAQADNILMEAMGVLGVSKITRWTIYLGVRVGGMFAWDSYSKKKETLI